MKHWRITRDESVCLAPATNIWRRAASRHVLALMPTSALWTAPLPLSTHTTPQTNNIYMFILFLLCYSFQSSPDDKFLLLFRSVVQCIDHIHAIVSDLLLLSFNFKLLLACVWAVVLVAVPICVLVVGSSVYVVVHADLIAFVPFPFIFILSTVLFFVFVSWHTPILGQIAHVIPGPRVDYGTSCTCTCTPN